MPDVTDDHTKTSRSDDDGLMDSRIQYENAPLRGLPGIF